MSELHLQIIRERLKRRDKVEVETREPKIPYRETIQINAEGSYRHKKQSGGRGQFGEVHIRMFPLPKDVDIEQYAVKDRFPSMKDYHYDPKDNFLWVNSIVGGTIPSNFLPAVEKGFKERIERGVVAGYQGAERVRRSSLRQVPPRRQLGTGLQDRRLDGLPQRVPAGQAGAARADREDGNHRAQRNLGDINSDMSGRRGRVLGMDSAGGDLQTIQAEVPLAEVTTYARSLSSITGGQGSYTIEFSHYDIVPGNVQQEIIAKASLEEEEEE